MRHRLAVPDLEFQQMQGANQVCYLKQLVVPRFYALRKLDGTRNGRRKGLMQKIRDGCLDSRLEILYSVFPYAAY